MTNPHPHIERLGRFGKLVAMQAGLFTPDHAWVKEFLRAYFGPEYATRTVIRTVAERLLAPEDALIGVSLELARSGRGILTAADVRDLLDATPRIPGPPVAVPDADIEEFRTEVLARYDRPTVNRVLHSIVHTLSQAAVRELAFSQLTPDTFRHQLATRTEFVVEDIVDRLAQPIPPALVEPLAELFPTLQTGDVRDTTFAAELLRSPQLSTRYPSSTIESALRDAWAVGFNQGFVAVLTAATNPDVVRRLPEPAARWINQGLWSKDPLVRAAAIRTLGTPQVRILPGINTESILRHRLRTSPVATKLAVFDVLNTGGLELLGPRGRHRFIRRLERWTYSSSAAANTSALHALTRPGIRAEIGTLVTSRLLEQLRNSNHLEVRSRAQITTTAYRRGPNPDHATTITLDWTVPCHIHTALTNIVHTSLRYANEGIDLPPPHKVKGWPDLDPEFDRPLDLPATAAAIDGVRLQNYWVRVLRTPRDLSENADRQRNCTKSWGESLSRGNRILVAVEDVDGRTTCNADWLYADGAWRLGGVLGKGNDPRVDRDLHRALVGLTRQLNQSAHRSLAERAGPLLVQLLR
jgi:hypothetical protein